MEPYPNGSVNISQSLFILDENLMDNNNGLSTQLYNSKNIANWNTFPNQGIYGQEKAYLNQSRISQFYQSSGVEPVLGYTRTFDLPPLGGKVDFSMGQNGRPVIPEAELAKSQFNQKQYTQIPTERPIAKNMKIHSSNGISLPSFMHL